MTEDVREHAQKLANGLEAAGHAEHAAKVHHVLSGNHPGETFLKALRGVCDTLLTMVEAIDPVSEITLEDLRNRLDAKLTPEKPQNQA